VRSSKLKGKLTRSRPEAKIEADIIKFLRLRAWFVKNIHGGKYQSGLPDLYACHANYGSRWVEVKLPGMIGSKFTKAQKDTFPQMIACGGSIWIMTAANEREYAKLFKPGNAQEYLIMHML